MLPTSQEQLSVFSTQSLGLLLIGIASRRGRLTKRARARLASEIEDPCFSQLGTLS
jgi:hypothetical protein